MQEYPLSSYLYYHFHPFKNVNPGKIFVRIIKLLRASIKISKKRRKLERKNRYSKKNGKKNKKKILKMAKNFKKHFFKVFKVSVFGVKIDSE